MRLISGCMQPTQLSWLQVLSSVAPPSLRCKAATDNMLQVIEVGLCMRADVFEHPPPRLASQRPMWSGMKSVDTITQCREDWSSASVVSHTVVTDPTIRRTGFNLPRHTWSLRNCFPTVKAHVVLTCTIGVSPDHLPVIVACDRP